MHSSENTYFVLAPPRSGSTWLQQTLDVHPEAACLYEPPRTPLYKAVMWLLAPFDKNAMGEKNPKDRVRIGLDSLPVKFHYAIGRMDRQLGKTSKRLSGAKIVFPQLVEDMDFVRFFMHYKKAKFLLLSRSSSVDAMCSLAIARRTRLAHSETARHEALRSFSVSTEHAQHYLMSQLLYEKLIRTFLRELGKPFLEVSYEQLMSSTQDTLQEIADFLGISPFQHHSRLQKLMVSPYRETITNYDELVRIENGIKEKLAATERNGSSLS